MNDIEQLFYGMKAMHYEQLSYTLVLGGGIIGLLTTEGIVRAIGCIILLIGLFMEFMAFKIEKTWKKKISIENKAA